MLLSGDDVIRLLRELGQRLDARGVRGDLFLVGGAAMAVAYGRDRLTRDIDAVFEPKALIYEIAADLATHHGLPADWLNDAVKGFVATGDPNATTLLDEPGLRVLVASPRFLFTLKAVAARVDRDAKDLTLLYRLCGFTSVDQALDHVTQNAPPATLRPKTEFLLRELLDEPVGEPVHGTDRGRSPGRVTDPG